jgi:hypothetical protein
MNQMLFYATGGFNFSRVTVSGGPAGGPLDTDTVTFHSGLRSGYGWSVGLGVERAFSHGISASFEYRYVNVGDEFISLAPTLHGEHFVAAWGHTFRIGVTARFGGRSRRAVEVDFTKNAGVSLCRASATKRPANDALKITATGEFGPTAISMS